MTIFCEISKQNRIILRNMSVGDYKPQLLSFKILCCHLMHTRLLGKQLGLSIGEDLDHIPGKKILTLFYTNGDTCLSWVRFVVLEFFLYGFLKISISYIFFLFSGITI